jgi:hypothetical protein
MVERPSPLSVESAVALLRSTGFGVEHGYLDPNPHNEAGAAHFVCGSPEQRVLVQVGAGAGCPRAPRASGPAASSPPAWPCCSCRCRPATPCSSSPPTAARARAQVRLEANPQNRQQFRVTVSSASPLLSSSIKDMLVDKVRSSA